MRRRGAPWLLVVGAFLLLVVPSSVTYYTDWLWFRELGYEGIFLRSLNAQVFVFGATFAVTEMTPWPPSRMRASAVASSPL